MTMARGAQIDTQDAQRAVNTATWKDPVGQRTQRIAEDGWEETSDSRWVMEEELRFYERQGVLVIPCVRECVWECVTNTSTLWP